MLDVHVCQDAIRLITNNPPFVIKRPERSVVDKRICALSVNVADKRTGLNSAMVLCVYAADPLSVNRFRQTEGSVADKRIE